MTSHCPSNVRLALGTTRSQQNLYSWHTRAQTHPYLYANQTYSNTNTHTYTHIDSHVRDTNNNHAHLQWNVLRSSNSYEKFRLNGLWPVYIEWYGEGETVNIILPIHQRMNTLWCIKFLLYNRLMQSTLNFSKLYILISMKSKDDMYTLPFLRRRNK